jgi:hypothetical protein
MLEKIVSGGQTGVDRAALDVAQQLRLVSGGWCPKGRLAEDGTIAGCYTMQQTPSTEYAQRTEWNVRDSDGTLVLTRSRRPSEGTAFTIEMTKRLRKPCLILDLGEHPTPAQVELWLGEHHILTLNVAGPRESKCPGIYQEAKSFLLQALAPKSTVRP